jgi:exodeoxyribonuclease VII large subunit
MAEADTLLPRERIWPVGALCKAVADALSARFNPVAVAGEISGFSRATSGHCYFSIKDDTGQLRCAMFRRAALALDFAPRDGDQVELRGRLSVYEARGDLQLLVDSLRRAGQGTLFEQFMRLKAKLEVEGWFDPARKRPLPTLPRRIGVVTSLGAAALHDVVSALQRRVPHIPVVIAPAAVQGAGAPQELVQALTLLRTLTPPVDVILLVRGGGAMEDLWAFNDEQLVQAIAQSPIPVVSGVGHETDFTLVDFAVDLRAPTPTAAAELVCAPREVWMSALQQVKQRLDAACLRVLDTHSQRLDVAASRLGRPSVLLMRQQLLLMRLDERLRHAVQACVPQARHRHAAAAQQLSQIGAQQILLERQRLERARLRLNALNPQLVLERGYAWLADAQGQPISSVEQVQAGQHVQATLADGLVNLVVRQRGLL